MRKISEFSIACTVLLAIFAVHACDHEDVVQTEKIREITNRVPEIYSVVPPQSNPTAAAGERVVFIVRARDPDGDDLSFQFCVDDSICGYDSVYTYESSQVGNRVVRVEVSDGLDETSHTWLLRVVENNDDIPPAEVEILSVGPGDLPHELEVRWTAVGDDGMDGLPRSYIIATSDTDILDETDWSLAQKHTIDDPIPAPGTEMATVFNLVGAASLTAVIVRAQDETGNLSPMGASVSGPTRGYANTGVVYDVFTGEPVEGVVIRWGQITTATGPDGRWTLEELPVLSGGLRVSDDDQYASVGDYYDYEVFEPNVHNAFFKTFLLPVVELESGHFVDFLQFALGMTDWAGVPYPSYLRHWDPPIAVSIASFGRDGLDYKATVADVLTGINDLLGFTAFNVVESPPAVGVECVFRSNISRDSYGVRQYDEQWYPVSGRVQFRTVYTPDSESAFRRVIVHEFGHALGLVHSTDPKHVMVGGTGAPKVDTFNADELAVIALIYGMPRDVSDGVFLRE